MRRLLLATSIFAALATCPAGAGAAAVGDDLTHAPEAWSASAIFVQALNADRTPYTGFPAPGVLTSVSVRTNGIAGTVKVYVLRKTGEPGSGSISMLNTGDVIPIDVPAVTEPASEITTVPVRRPVAAGDRFGLETVLGLRALWIYPSVVDFDYCAYGTPPHVAQMTINYTTIACNNHIPLAQGVVEPDVDGDGFGDDSQDQCPSDASRQTPCPASPTTGDLELVIKRTAKVRSGGVTIRTYVVWNNGSANLSKVRLTVHRPRGAKSVRILSRRAKSTRSRSTVEIPELAAKRSTSFSVAVISTVQSKLRVKATVSTPDAEQDLTDNSLTALYRFKH